MATGPGFAGSGNSYIPNWAASGRLAVAFSRNPKDFPLMKWLQLTESPKHKGYYLKITAQVAARVASMNDFLWNWNAERPDHPDGIESFTYVPFTAQRWENGFNLDDDTDRQAEWDVAETFAKMHAQLAMTIRANNCFNVFAKDTLAWKTAANSGTNDQTSDMTADHTGTASAFAGGTLNSGTTTNPYVKIFLDKASVLIDLDSLGTIRPEQLHAVMNPNTARLIAESAEIHDYIKGSPDAMHEIRTGSSPNAKYGPGLPSTLYGMDIVVDNTVLISSRKGATLNKAYAFPDQTIMIASRPGELEGVYNTPSWSTCTWFWYRDEMTLERKNDDVNRRILFRLVDCGIPVLSCPMTGYLLTNATSVAS